MRVSVRPFGKGGQEGVVTAPGEQLELSPGPDVPAAGGSRPARTMSRRRVPCQDSFRGARPRPPSCPGRGSPAGTVPNRWELSRFSRQRLV